MAPPPAGTARDARHPPAGRHRRHLGVTPCRARPSTTLHPLGLFRLARSAAPRVNIYKEYSLLQTVYTTNHTVVSRASNWLPLFSACRVCRTRCRSLLPSPPTRRRPRRLPLNAVQALGSLTCNIDASHERGPRHVAREPDTSARRK